MLSVTTLEAFGKAQANRARKDFSVFEKGWEVRAGGSVVQIHPYISWNDPDITGIGDRNGYALLHMWRWLDETLCTLESLNSTDPRKAGLFIEIIEVLDTYAAANPAMASYDAAAGEQALRLAILLTQRREIAVRDEQDSWIATLDVLVNRTLDTIRQASTSPNPTNHILWEIHGLMGLGRAQDQQVSMDLAENRLRGYLDDAFEPSMVLKEDALDYHRFILRRLRVLDQSGWYGDLLRDHISQGTERLKSWTMKDGRLPAIGDSPLKLGKDEDFLPGISLDYSLKMESHSGWISGRATFADSTADSFILLMGACNSGIHKHSDDLSIWWTEGDHDILIDPGKCTYSHGSIRESFVSAPFHNVVSIDGGPVRARTRSTVPPLFSAVQAEDGELHAYGVVEDIAGTWHRNVRWRPRQLVVTDIVDLEEYSSIGINWQLGRHSIGARTYVPANELVWLPLLCERTGRLGSITVHSSHELTAFHAYGERDPSFFGWRSEAYGEITPSHSTRFECRARSLTLTTTLAVETPIPTR